jgi:hypothetical protein
MGRDVMVVGSVDRDGVFNVEAVCETERKARNYIKAFAPHSNVELWTYQPAQFYYTRTIDPWEINLNETKAGDDLP